MLHGNGTIAFEWSLAGLSLVFVLLRLYVRVYNPDSRHDWSGYIVVAAWLNFAACCACDTATHQLGLRGPDITYRYTGGLLRVNSDPEKNIRLLKIIYGSTLPYLIDLWLIKAGILTFYYTIIPKAVPLYRLLHIVSGFSVITFILVFIGNGFWCTPIRNNWSLDPEEICISSAKVPPFFGTVGSNIATDLMIFCLPFPLLRSMSLPRQKMIGIIFVFTLGFLTTLAAICRVVAISISATAPTVVFWTAIECSTGITVACVPALRVLIIRRENCSNPSRNRTKRSYPRPGPSILSAADRNEIWDGTDATAPQWIRMASMPSGMCPTISPKNAQFDESVDSVLTKQLTPQKNSKEYGAQSIDASSMVTPIPNMRLQIGRGIVEHAPMASPTSPTSGHQQVRTTSPTSSSPVSTLGASNSSFVRLNGSDDTLPYTLNRWDTGEGGRLELGRIVDRGAGVNRPRSISVLNGKSRLGKSSLNPDHE